MEIEEIVFSAEKPKIYCGNELILPDGYDEFGTPYECLRKGVGVGLFVIPEDKRQEALAKKRKRKILSSIELSKMANRLQVTLVDDNGLDRSRSDVLKDVRKILEAMQNIFDE